MLWEASILSKRWAMHSNDTQLKFRRKQQCRLFQQKTRITGVRAQIILMTNNSAATSRVSLGSSSHESKVQAWGCSFPLERGAAGDGWEVKIPHESSHPNSPVPGPRSCFGHRLTSGTSAGIKWQRTELGKPKSRGHGCNFSRASESSTYSGLFAGQALPRLPLPLQNSPAAARPGNEMAKTSFQTVPCRHPLHPPGLRKGQREAAVKYGC